MSNKRGFSSVMVWLIIVTIAIVILSVILFNLVSSFKGGLLS